MLLPPDLGSTSSVSCSPTAAAALLPPGCWSCAARGGVCLQQTYCSTLPYTSRRRISSSKCSRQHPWRRLLWQRAALQELLHVHSLASLYLPVPLHTASSVRTTSLRLTTTWVAAGELRRRKKGVADGESARESCHCLSERGAAVSCVCRRHSLQLVVNHTLSRVSRRVRRHLAGVKRLFARLPAL